MASIHKEVSLASTPAEVWDIVRDIGAVHTRFAPGFVVNTEMDVLVLEDAVLVKEDQPPSLTQADKSKYLSQFALD